MKKLNKITSIVTLIALSLLFIMGCDNTPTEVEDYEPEAVLFSFQEALEPTADVYLQWVNKNIYSQYSETETGISDATVILYPLFDDLHDGAYINEPGNPPYAEMITFSEDPAFPGHYLPDNPDTIRTGWRYRIEASDGESLSLWAETTMPDTFTLALSDQYPDTLIGYEPSDTLEIEEYADVFPTYNRNDPVLRSWWSDAWPDPSYFAEPEVGYLLNIIALTDTVDLVPLDPSWDPDDPDDVIDPEDKGRLGWTFAPDYMATIEIVWIYFDWAGPHRVDVIASSKELYRYMITNLMFGDPSGDKPRYDSNINGGMGVFGGTVKKSFYLNMEALEE
ncbi:DUF4249 family protein [bacterium]|nr:DUF4249 family protein [bacterium]